MNRDVTRRIATLEAFYSPIDWSNADALSLALRDVKQADLRAIAAEIDGTLPQNTDSCHTGGDYS